MAANKIKANMQQKIVHQNAQQNRIVKIDPDSACVQRKQKHIKTKYKMGTEWGQILKFYLCSSN
jgi:hypothetical protein